MSRTGTPSVIQIISSIPFSAASIIASFENLAGTFITEVFALVSVTASLTVLKTGKLKCSWPPFPGVTPPTILVPYAMHCSACIVACEPVKP